MFNAMIELIGRHPGLILTWLLYAFACSMVCGGIWGWVQFIRDRRREQREFAACQRMATFAQSLPDHPHPSPKGHKTPWKKRRVS